MIRVGLARTLPSYARARAALRPGQGLARARAAARRRTRRQGAPTTSTTRCARGAPRARARRGALRHARTGTRSARSCGAAARRAQAELHPALESRPRRERRVRHHARRDRCARSPTTRSSPSGAEGRVAIAEAPQHDCDWERIRAIAGLDALVDFYDASSGSSSRSIDLRREAVTYRDGVIVERRALPGDPAGYRLVDLGAHSRFARLGPRPAPLPRRRLRPGPDHAATTRADATNTCSRRPCCRADLRREPAEAEDAQEDRRHARAQESRRHQRRQEPAAAPLRRLAASQGGDEFPGGAAGSTARAARATEVARWLLARGIGDAASCARCGAPRTALRGDALLRSGNWYGNRTTWRMVPRPEPLPLLQRRARRPLRRAGPRAHACSRARRRRRRRGRGPARAARRRRSARCSPPPIRSRSTSRRVRLMGFDERQLPKIREAMAEPRRCA